MEALELPVSVAVASLSEELDSGFVTVSVSVAEALSVSLVVW